MKSLGQLKRRKFISFRKGRADVAVGVLAALVVELNGTAAHAGEADLVRFSDDSNANPETPSIDLAAMRSLSVEELKALFTPEQLKALGIDAAEFASLIDVDVAAAIKLLDQAFHKHVDAVAAANHKLAAAAGSHTGHAGDRDSADHDSGEGFAGVSPLLILGGLAVVGGGIALIAGGSSTKPVTTSADTVTTAEDTSVTFDPRSNDKAGSGALTVTKINGTDIAANGTVAITGGSVKLNADGTLTFTPAANFNGTPSFTYSVVDGKGTTGTSTVNLTVTSVNDVPTASNVTVTTAEDTVVKFDPRTSAADADGDSLTVTAINGTAITATTPVTIASGVVSLNADGTLSFAPKANFNGTPSFTYTLSDGKGGTVTATANLTVTAVNDAPVNTVPASFETTSGTALTIGGLAISDVDAAGTYTTTIKTSTGTLMVGTVTGGSTVAGAGTDTLVLSGSIDQVNATLKAIMFSGSAGFSGTAKLTVTTSDGFLTDTDSFDVTVAQVQTGVVIDGYVGGADVFVDVNGNGKQDPGEPFGKTNGKGEFMLVGNGKGPIVASGGFNTDTGLPNKLVLTTPVGSTVVSPLSTIVQSLIAQGESPANAKALVADMLGFAPGVDVTSYDPLAPGADPVLALQVQKSLATVAALMTATYDVGGADAVSALVGKLAAAADAGVELDLTDLATVTDLLTGLPGVSAEEVTSASLVAVSAAQAIEAAESLGDIVQAMKDTLTPGADLPVVTQADVVETQVEADFVGGKVTFNTFAAVNVLANDIDAEKSTLTLVSINGVDISKNNGIVQFDNYTVTALPTGDIKIESNDPAFAGSYSFEYTVADAAGNLTTETVTVNVAPFGTSIGTDAEDLPAVVASTADLVAAGITTVDLTADAGTITESQAATLIDAGLHFAAEDVVSVQADGTHLSTTLKGLTDLHVASIVAPMGASVLSIEAGAGLDGLSVGSLPQFDIAQSDAALDVTLNIAPGAVDASLDLSAIATALNAAGVDHIGDNGGALSVTLAQAGQISTAGLDFATSADVSVMVGADGLATLDAGLLGNLNVDHIDIASDAGTITDAQASAIVDAGLDFVVADDVTVQADGTHMATTLKGLQTLHVDAVAVAVGVSMLSIDAGAGGLGGLSVSDLPQFDTLQSDAALDVTLNVSANGIAPDLDLSAIGAALNDAGIDHIGSAGDTLSVTLAQAKQIDVAGLDFAVADDISVQVNSDALGALDAAALAAINVDRIDLASTVTVISDAKANEIVNAGLEFAENDIVEVAAEGTTMATSLKSLGDLGVTAIHAEGSTLTLSAGEGGLAGLSTSDLPQINPGQEDSMIDVTLDIGGSIAPSTDLGALAQGLAMAGVDYLSSGNAVSITGQQLGALDQAGIAFTQGSDVTLSISQGEFGSQGGLRTLGVDHIDITGDALVLSDDEAAKLVAAGIDFAIDDAIQVEAHGTHMSTTLQGLHDLNVDTVQIGAGESKLVLAAGSLAELTADTIPSFVEAQSDDAADITLVVGANDFADLLRLGTALNVAGIDHLAFNGVVTPDLQSQMDAIAATAGIDFVPFVDGQPTDTLAASQSYVYAQAEDSIYEASFLGDLLQELEDTATVGGTLDVTDATAASLLESGLLSAYLADTLVIDATDSGDKLYSTLKSLADVGADSVLLSHQDGGPVYVSLGLEGSTVTADDVANLLNALSHDGTFEKIFDGADHVSLVVDESVASALSGVDGAMQHLADLGFTEVDVLDTTGALPALPADPAIEIKVIGQADDLYDYLHNPK